jgi:predicted DNA-binding transcriptional regulator AlpA
MSIATIRNDDFSRRQPANHSVGNLSVVGSSDQPPAKFGVQSVSSDLYQTNEDAALHDHNDERLLNARQVADKLGVSERWVRDHTTRRFPKIRAIKMGMLVRYRRADVDVFMQQLDTLTPSIRSRFSV